MTVAGGDCVVSCRYNDDGTLAGLWIEHADPRVLISPELLESVAENKADWPASYDDGVLRIRGLNRTVIYRVTGRILNGSNYRDPCVVAEWPD